MSKSNWSLKKAFRSVLPTPTRASDGRSQAEQSTVELLAEWPDDISLAPSEHNGDIHLGKPLDVPLQDQADIQDQPDTQDLDFANDPSIRLWNKAYNSIRRSNYDLVKTFEEVLSQQITGDGAPGDVRGNVVLLSRFNGGTRFTLMKQAVEKSIEKAEVHETVKDGILRVSNLVVDLKGIGSAVLSSQPAAAMAWSGICAILPILARPWQQEQAMIQGLNHVVSSMDWYMNLTNCVVDDPWEGNSRLSKLKAGLEGRIVRVYEAMLEYQMESVAHCYDKHPIIRGVKTILGSNDWTSRTKDLEKRENELKRELSQYSSRQGNDIFSSIARNTETTLEHLRKQFGQTTLSERASIIGRFKTTCYEQFMEDNPPRVPGTCEWLRNHSSFTDWKNQAFGLLLVSAGPGCGKSVLARYLVQDVLPYGNPAATVAYFFFKNNPEQRSMANALCAIIHRILYQLNDLVEYCKDEIQANGPELLSDLSSLWRVLESAVGHPNKRQVICVLDGLDECDEIDRRKFVQLLRELLRRRYIRPPSVKFLITAREDPEILQEFQGFESTYTISLSEDSKKKEVMIEGLPVLRRGVDLLGEIDLVVDHHLNQLMDKKGLTPDMVDSIEKALREPVSEPRTYLWVSRVLDVMEQNRDNRIEKWEKLIQHPPRTVFQAYEEMLQRISGEEVDQVVRLFHLIIAAERPLTVHELNVALNIREREVAYSEEDLALPSDESFQRWIASTCGGFVTEFDDGVCFIHRTAQEFLLTLDDGLTPDEGTEGVWEGCVTMIQAHRTLAESCIAYLSLGVFTTSKFKKVTRVFNEGLREAQEKLLGGELYPDEFLDHAYDSCKIFVQDHGLSSYSLYVLQHWVGHFDLAQEFDGDLFVRDIDPALDAAYLDLFDDTVPIKRPWLVMAAQVLEEDCGYRLTEFDKETGTVRCHHSVNAASLAALFGHYRLTEWFLGETTPDTKDDLSKKTSQDDLVIDPPSTGLQPVFFAAAMGHPKCLSYILTKPHLNLDGVQDQLLRTPLHQAARLGRYDCLEPLAHLCDITQQDVHGWTAFDYLIHRINGIQDLDSSRTTLRTLVQTRGEKSDDPSGRRVSLLSLAAKFPNETFLEKRSRPELAQDILDSRLFLVAYEGSLIKFLVDQGESVNKAELSGLTPLHFASTRGYLWNVMFLLRAGADPSIADELGRTSLHCACSWTTPTSITLVSALLGGGASPNSCDVEGKTPFVLAILRPDDLGDALVEVMLEYGAHPHQRLPDGYTPLDKARWSGNSNRVDAIEGWLLNTSMLWSLR